MSLGDATSRDTLPRNKEAGHTHSAQMSAQAVRAMALWGFFFFWQPGQVSNSIVATEFSRGHFWTPR